MASDPCTPEERAVYLCWLFAGGRRMTTREVACLVGLSERSALNMLMRMSRMIPLVRIRHQWQILK